MSPRSPHYFSYFALTSFVLVGVFGLSSSVLAVNFPTFTITFGSSKLYANQLLTSTITAAPVNDFSLSAVASSTVIIPPVSHVLQVASDTLQYASSTGVIFSGCTVTAPAGSIINNLMPSVSSLSQVNNTTWMATYILNGLGLYNVTDGNRTRQTGCTINQTANATTGPIVWAGYVDGSLASSTYASTSVLISGLSPSTSIQNIYSATDYVNHVFTRNPSLFIPYDITAIPACIGTGGSCSTTGVGILISPDIMLCAYHVACSPGDTEYFVTATGTVVTDTVTAGIQINSSSTFPSNDVYIARLSTPLIGYNITPAYVFPLSAFQVGTSTGNYQSTTAINADQIPAYAVRQNQQISIGTLSSIDGTFGLSYDPVNNTSSTFHSWGQAIIGGDSGTPVFTVVNGKVVALFAMSGTSAGVGSGIWEASYKILIAAAITSLGSSYQPTEINLNAYPTY
jgi:hypothetical protein